MKTQKTFQLLALLITSLSFGQITTDPATGNVGIGTTTPGAKLDVVGNLQVNGGADSFYGFGNSSSAKPIDARPNSQFPYIFNWHTGLTFSAHSAYGGIRFYNQGYPDMYGAGVLVMSINNNNVGIGTATPEAKLEVTGETKINGTLNVSGNNALNFSTFGGGLYMSDTSWIRTSGNKNFYHNTGIMRTDGLFQVGPNGDRLVVDANGKVGIGITNPFAKLDVNGDIHAKEVRVDLSGWPDYVFQKYYTGKSELNTVYVMPTLAEIENFTKKNHHLPNVPSAQEIKENGLSLGEMSNVLLQKIEELTLYAIEQNKVIEELKAQVNTLMNKK